MVLGTMTVPESACTNTFLTDQAAIRASAFLTPSGRDPLLSAQCLGLLAGSSFPPETSTVSPPRSQGIASQRASSKTRLEAPIPNPATSPTVLPSHRALLAHLGWPQRTHEMIPNSCQLMEPLAALETGPRLQNRLDRSVN